MESIIAKSKEYDLWHNIHKITSEFTNIMVRVYFCEKETGLNSMLFFV